MWRKCWHQILCCTHVQFIPCDIPQVHCRGDVSTVCWPRLVSLMGLRCTGRAITPLPGWLSFLSQLLAPVCRMICSNAFPGCLDSLMHCTLCMRLLTGAVQHNLSRDNLQDGKQACWKSNIMQFVSDQTRLTVGCESSCSVEAWWSHQVVERFVTCRETTTWQK